MSASPETVRVARVVRAHGVAGEVRLELLGGSAGRLAEGVEVRSAAGPRRVERIRGSADAPLCQLSGISDRDAALALAGSYLEVGAEALPELAEGEYYHFQLVGLEVRDETGRRHGELVEVETYPANDVYLVRTEEGEVRIPAVRSAVLGVDLAAGVMTVAAAYLEGWVDAV